MDGTVYLGDQALPGAVETVAALRRNGRQVLFVSNKPLEPGLAYARKLTSLGIPAWEDEIITSAFVLGSHLSLHHPGLRYFVVGEPALLAELAGFGLQIVNERFQQQDPLWYIDPAGIDAVIVAFDRTLDYRKLNIAYQALKAGAHFFATNSDKACPVPGGGVPDAGGTLAALEHMTGRRVELLAGKPSPLILQTAMQRLNLPPQSCVMVGDRLETDIRMGKEAGMLTGVVLTGVTSRADVALSPYQPDVVLENLGELLPWLNRMV